MELNELENGHSSSARMSVRLDNPEAPSSSPPPSPSTPLRMMTPSKLPSSLPSTPPAVSVSATAAASASPAPSSAEASARAWRSGKFSKSSKWSGLSVLGGSSAALLSSAGSAVNLFRGTSNKNLEPPKLEDVLSDSHRDGRLTKDSLRSFLESEYVWGTALTSTTLPTSTNTHKQPFFLRPNPSPFAQTQTKTQTQ